MAVRATFSISGSTLNEPPVNWREVRITKEFDGDAAIANIDVDTFRFVGENAKIIKDAKDNGGLFQALPMNLNLTDGTDTVDIPLYLDMTSYKENNPGDISVKVARAGTMDNIFTRLQALTYGLLLDEGRITDADYTRVKAVIKKEFEGSDLFLVSLTLFLLAKQGYETALAVEKSVKRIAAEVASLSPARLAAEILILALQLVFMALILIQLIILFKQALNLIFPIPFNRYGITYRKALEKAFDRIGYAFSSPITDLDWVFLPSKPEGSRRITQGIPNPSDFEYNCLSMLEACKKMFKAAINVDETLKRVTLLPLNSSVWQQQASYVMPDVLDEQVEYNTEEIRAATIVSFAIDGTDFWTSENYLGTAYEINVKSALQNPTVEFNMVRNLEEVRFSTALGSIKEPNSLLDISMKGLAKSVDKLITALGGSPEFSNRINESAGYLKMGSKYHTIPKTLLVNSAGKIPTDHRDRLSARYLWENYLCFNNLVSDNFAGQKRVYKERKIPFTFSDFVAVNHKYFSTFDGRNGEFNKISWAFDLDYAIADYRVQEVYDSTLVETFIEAE